MPKHLAARPAIDATEARQVRKLAHSAHAPADWIFHAKRVVRSWDGLRTRQIAEDLGCHPQTVRERLHAFNDRGLDGLGIKPGAGRKPRLTQLERSTFLALVKRPPPGKPTYERTGELEAPDPDAEPEWTLDTLTDAAHEHGIQVARSQVRRIFRREGVRWRRTRLWATSTDPDCAPQGPQSSRSPRSRRPRRRSSTSTNAAPNAPPFPARAGLVGRWPPHQGVAEL
jgi:transposase